MTAWNSAFASDEVTFEQKSLRPIIVGVELALQIFLICNKHLVDISKTLACCRIVSVSVIQGLTLNSFGLQCKLKNYTKGGPGVWQCEANRVSWCDKVGFGLSVLTHEITHSTCASRFWSADTELLYFQSVKFKLRQGKKKYKWYIAIIQCKKNINCDKTITFCGCY